MTNKLSMNKTENILVILVFLMLLAVPILTTNVKGGEISQSEKRVLAKFPTMVNLGERIANREFMRDVENWLNDHIGQRSISRKIYAQIMNRYLRISTSNSVLFGRKGWYFYTEGHNIEIAKGTYPLNRNDLHKIIMQQKRVADYYSAQKVRYFLCLTPSKVSIYPEYLPFKKKNKMVEPSEIVQKALDKNGNVINVKKAVKSKKSTGRLFHLTDSHWVHRGSYIAYTEILKKIDKSLKPIPQNYKPYKRTGDLFSLLGLEAPRYKEEVEGFSFQWNSKQLKDNELDQELLKAIKQSFKQQKTVYIRPEIFVNKKVKKGTVVIYGDSMMAGYLNVPKYLCEHFHKVVVLRLRKIAPELDDMIKPDIVIYSITERLIRDFLTQFASSID